MIITPLFIRYSEEELKEKLKFYTQSTITSTIAEIELEHLITPKEYKQLIRMLYG